VLDAFELIGAQKQVGACQVVGELRRLVAGLHLFHLPEWERPHGDAGLPISASPALVQQAESLHGRIVVLTGEMQHSGDTGVRLAASSVEAMRRPWLLGTPVPPLPREQQLALLGSDDPARAIEAAFRDRTGIDLARLRTLDTRNDAFLAHQVIWLETQRSRLFDIPVADFYRWALQQSSSRFAVQPNPACDGWSIASEGVAHSVRFRRDGQVLRVEADVHSPDMAHAIVIGAALADAVGRNLALAWWPGREEARDAQRFFGLAREAYDRFREGGDLVSAEQVASTIVVQFAEWESLRAEFAAALRLLGHVFYETGRFVLADPFYQAAVANSESLPADHRAVARTCLAMTWSALGWRERAEGEARKAIADFRQAGINQGDTYLRALEIAAGADTPPAQAAAPASQVVTMQFRSLQNEVQAAIEAGELASAEQALLTALQALPAEAADERIDALASMGRVRSLQGNHAGAFEAFRQCLAVLEAVRPQQRVDIGWIQARCGRQAAMMSRHADAYRHGLAAAAIFAEAAEAEPDGYQLALEVLVPAAQEVAAYADAERACRTLIDLLNSRQRISDAEAAQWYRTLGEICCEQGRFDAARPALLTGCRLIHRFDGRFSRKAGGTLRELTRCAMARGRWSLAMALARRAARTTAGDPVYAIVHIRAIGDMARVLAAQRRLQEAADAHEHCLTRAREILGEDHLETAVCYSNYALLAGELDRREDHERMLLRCLAIKRKLLGDDDIQLATTYNNLGVCFNGLGRMAQALEFHERALALRRQHLTENHPDVANSELNLAACMMESGRLDESEALLKAGIARQHVIYGRNSVELVDALGLYASLFRLRGNFQSEERMLTAAIRLVESAQGQGAPRAANLYVNLAHCRRRQGSTEAAARDLASALAIYGRLDNGDPQGLARALLAQADLAGRVGATVDEIESLEQCLLLLNEATGYYRHDLKDRLLALMYRRGQNSRAEKFLTALLDGHPAADADRVQLCYDLQGLLLDLGRFEDSHRLLMEIEAILERIEKPGSMAFSEVYVQQARGRLQQERVDEAERLCRQALDIEARMRPQQPSFALGQAFRTLADIAVYRQDGKTALELYQQAATVMQLALGPDHSTIGMLLSAMAPLHYQQNQVEVARALLQRALAIKERQWGTEAPGLIADLNNLATISLLHGDLAAAEGMLTRAMQIIDKNLGDSHVTSLRQRGLMADLRERQGRLEEARDLLTTAIAALEQTAGEESIDLANMLCRYAGFCWRQQKPGEGCEHQARAARIFERVLGPHHPTLAEVLDGLVVLLRESGRELEIPLIQSRIKVIQAKAQAARG
jgi:tetratricopeptide (TPR) repeat protein